MKRILLLPLICIISSCRQITVSGDKIEIGWALGPSLSAIALAITIVFLTRFIIVGSWSQIFTGKPGIALGLRTSMMSFPTLVMLFGGFILTPIFAFFAAKTGYGENIEMTRLFVSRNGNRYEWEQLRQIEGSSKDDHFLLIFANNTDSIRLQIAAADYGVDAMKLIRAWVMKAALENHIPNGKYKTVSQ